MNKQISHILVNGDSFSHERHFAFDESYVEKTWAYSLGAKNIALGGCSNDRIFYSTIEYLNDNIVDILIIGWTSCARGWLTLSNGLNLNLLPGGSADDLLFGHNKEDKTLQIWKEYEDFYYKKCFNEYLNFKKFLNYYLHLQDYCESKKIKFLNFMSFSEFPKNLKNIANSAYMNKSTKILEEVGVKHHEKILNDLISKFKKEHWVNKEVGFNYQELVKKKNFPLWPDGHPGLEASQYWGKLIKQHI
jgi:hypothetical protein